MNRFKGGMQGCVLVLVLTTLLLTAGVVKAAPLTRGTWKVVPSPNPGSGGNFLFGVTAISANDSWAAGYYFNSRGIPQTLIEHWNGTSWKVVPSPNVDPFSNFLSGVAAASAHDVWAVGDYLDSIGTPRTLIEHWDGKSWKIVSSPDIANGGALSGVAVVSARDVWAVGTSSAQTLMEHWNGKSWTAVASPNVGLGGNFLSGVAAASANNVWAVGNYLNNSAIAQTLIEHWNGKSWSIVPSPNVGPSDNLLNGVTATSTHDVWAVGSSFEQTLTEHWNGKSWTVVPSPNVGSDSNLLNGVAAVSASKIWAVGFYSSGIRRTLIEYWNGKSWAVVSSPNVGSNDNDFLGVAPIPHSSKVWAVGYYMSNSSNSRTLTELFC